MQDANTGLQCQTPELYEPTIHPDHVHIQEKQHLFSFQNMSIIPGNTVQLLSLSIGGDIDVSTGTGAGGESETSESGLIAPLQSNIPPHQTGNIILSAFRLHRFPLFVLESFEGKQLLMQITLSLYERPQRLLGAFPAACVFTLCDDNLIPQEAC